MKTQESSGFMAWVNARAGAACRGAFGRMTEAELDDGDVLIHVGYASVSTRDALASAGRPPLPSRLPCVGGADLAGEVIASAAPRFRPGDKVIATGYGLGIKHHGAFAERALLPGGWLLPLPAPLTMRASMALGTPGIALAMVISRLEDGGLKPERGPVLVSGAEHGHGTLAVALLAARGYEVVALSRHHGSEVWLGTLGASKVIICGSAEHAAIRQNARALWAAAIDNQGGEILPWLLASVKPGAGVAVVGEASSVVHSLGPFWERGVCLFGVDARQAGFATKEHAWGRLSGDLHAPALGGACTVVAFDALPEVFEQLLAGNTHGRTVVRIGAQGSEKESL
ncbi:MAG: oxidoreductase [Uliginosibacterium sp.]|nr:oxidoreductase [Uliginosibacterium sp.]